MHHPTPKPPRLRHVTSGHETDGSSNQISGFERVLKIRDPWFNEYVYKNMREIGHQRLLELSRHMYESDNPHVVAGAGSSATEAALWMPRKNALFKPSVTSRLHSLELAKMAWAKAGELSAAEKDNEVFFPDEYARQLLEFRLTHNLCFEPSFDLAARLMGGDTVNKDDWEFGAAETRQNLVALAEVVAGSEIDPARVRGFMYEVASGWALLRETDQRLTLPSSLRQDHNPEAALRADLITIESDSYRKTLVQAQGVESDPRRIYSDKKRVFIIARRDLVPVMGDTSIDIANFMVAENKGELTDEQASDLDWLSHTLHDRISTFRRAKDRR